MTTTTNVNNLNAQLDSKEQKVGAAEQNFTKTYTPLYQDCKKKYEAIQSDQISQENKKFLEDYFKNLTKSYNTFEYSTKLVPELEVEYRELSQRYENGDQSFETTKQKNHKYTQLQNNTAAFVEARNKFNETLKEFNDAYTKYVKTVQ